MYKLPECTVEESECRLEEWHKDVEIKEVFVK